MPWIFLLGMAGLCVLIELGWLSLINRLGFSVFENFWILYFLWIAHFLYGLLRPLICAWKVFGSWTLDRSEQSSSNHIHTYGWMDGWLWGSRHCWTCLHSTLNLGWVYFYRTNECWFKTIRPKLDSTWTYSRHSLGSNSTHDRVHTWSRLILS